MKALHYSLVAIVILAEIGVAALLVLSVAPLAMGGLTVDFEENPTTRTEDGMFIFDGEAFVESTMPWDITIRYDIILGTMETQIASLSNNDPVTIARDSRTSLPFHLEVPMVNAAMYIMSTGINDDGSLNDTITVPITFDIHAEYIMGLVKFDLSMTIEESADISEVSEITWGDNGSSLDIDLVFVGSSMIPLADGNYNITINDGSTNIVNGSIDISTGSTNELQFFIGSTSGENVIDVIKEAYDSGSMIIDINGDTWDPYENPEDVETFISLLEMIFGSAVIS